jgi:hypothetical protein
MAYSLDDSWDNCIPVARAGNACFGLYVRCGIWSARNLTDGFVPGEIASGYGSPEQARKLVDVGLWEVAEGGYRMPDYLDRNAAGEKVRARRKADAERRAKWRDRQHRKRGTRDETRESERSHGVTPAGRDASLPPLKGEEGARPPSAAPPDLSAVRSVLKAASTQHRMRSSRRDALGELRAVSPLPQDRTEDAS